MRFALLGDHPDGLDMARALVASGRHQLLIYCGPAAGMQSLQRLPWTPRSVGDLEEVLADHEIDAVIVASGPTLRPAQLRRAMQAECHVLCVHPADPSPDLAYEAAMIQTDTGRVLLPLLPLTFHPGVMRLAELARTLHYRDENQVAPAAWRPRLLEFEIWAMEEMLLEAAMPGHKPGLPGWDVLRLIGGEINEVFLLTAVAELTMGQPCLVSGRFLNGGLFQAAYLPNQAEARLRLSLVTTTGRTTLSFAQGWPGPAQLTYVDDQEQNHTETWEPFDPWSKLIEEFEQAVLQAAVKRPQPGQIADEGLTKAPPRLGWQDELRALELDDAARRSAERGRSSTLDLQESTEEASFKGTMTLVGCSLIWLSLVGLILSAWMPWLAWLILPVFGLFLVLQLLRWIVPVKDGPDAKADQ